ncbi:MAG: DUF4298 domain-containing protein [Bacteroidales bacterium]|nr:DUF4298 domain-containing protein [Bacteroidales bacterium]MBR0291373.1 DUF4298 domain-containing protein [Bacteroidales bacterium]
MSSELIRRVRAMEEDYNAVAEAVKALEEAVSGFEEVADRVQRLSEYMDSGLWRRDFEADEAGLLPSDLPRGVLSEDGLYNLLEDVEALRARLKEL